MRAHYVSLGPISSICPQMEAPSAALLGPAILGHALPFRKYEEPAEQVPAGPPAGQEWGQLTLLTQ